MTKPEIGDRILITDGLYGSKYGIYIGPTIGLGKRGKVRLDFDQKIHRLSYTKMLVLPEAAIVVQETSPSPPSPNPPSPNQHIPVTRSLQVTVASQSFINQSEQSTKEKIETGLNQAVEQLDNLKNQVASLEVLIKDLQSLLLSDDTPAP